MSARGATRERSSTVEASFCDGEEALFGKSTLVAAAKSILLQKPSAAQSRAIVPRVRISCTRLAESLPIGPLRVCCVLAGRAGIARVSSPRFQIYRAPLSSRVCVPDINNPSYYPTLYKPLNAAELRMPIGVILRSPMPRRLRFELVFHL